MELEEARETAPVLLEGLRDIAPKRAEFIEDVYSEVLRGLRRGEMKDRAMVDWLFEALNYHTREALSDRRVQENYLS